MPCSTQQGFSALEAPGALTYLFMIVNAVFIANRVDTNKINLPGR
jgi:hypothetical protein